MSRASIIEMIDLDIVALSGLKIDCAFGSRIIVDIEIRIMLVGIRVDQRIHCSFLRSIGA
jgi:hypothetical protein